MKTSRWVTISILVSLCACRGSSNGQPSFNLEPLTPLAGVSDWTMAGGGPGHSGYVHVTLDPTTFSPRWILSLPLGNSGGNTCGIECDGIYVSPAVTDSADQRVFVMVDDSFVDANVDEAFVSLLSLNESDGKPAWRIENFPSTQDQEGQNINDYSNPSFFNGRIYTSYYVDEPTFPSPLTHMNAYDAADGNVDFTQTPPCGTTCDVTQAVPSGTGVYSGRPLSAYDSTTGSVLWTDASGESDEGSAPAVEGNTVYISSKDPVSGDPEFVAFGTTSGSVVFKVGASTQEVSAEKSQGYTFIATRPMLDGTGGAIAVHYGYYASSIGFLNHYLLANHTLDWQVSGNFHGSPGGAVVAKGVIYICDGSAVDAIDDSNGSKLWHWSPGLDTSLTSRCSLLVTENLLFVSSALTTYAVDLGSHSQVWSYPGGGQLSLSPSGLLYVSIDSPPNIDPENVGPQNLDLGYLIAINLH
jgi:PQQ-like domain